MTLKTIVCCVALSLCVNAAHATKSVNLRLNPNFYDQASNSLYIDVDIQYSGHGKLVLADQNYRMYFDSENLHLDPSESFSDLPQDLYSDMSIKEVYEGVQVSGVDQLDFDHNLGFINFSIDLMDNLDGGIKLSREDGWQRVAVLKFEVKNSEDLSQIVWSRMGSTEDYATAFVEIMEWIAPNATEHVDIDQSENLEFQSEYNGNPDLSIKIGPNPASDFVIVDFADGAQESVILMISDITGKVIQNHIIGRGTDEIFVPIDHLMAATYKIEVIDLKTEKRLYTEKLMVSN